MKRLKSKKSIFSLNSYETTQTFGKSAKSEKYQPSVYSHPILTSNIANGILFAVLFVRLAFQLRHLLV